MFDSEQATDDATWNIRPIGPADRPAATRRLIRNASAASEAAASEELARRLGSEERLFWGSFDQVGHVGAVAVLIPLAGRVGVVFFSSPRRRTEIREHAAVVDRLCQESPRSVAILAQSLVDPDDWLEPAVLEGAGFQELATLSYLQRTVPARAEEPALPDGVTLTRWREERVESFLRTMEATYIDTRDCPKLRGLRRTEDILEGHLATGTFDPDLWALLRVDGEPAGMMLLSPLPQQRTAEVVYLGLTPAARGRHLGSLLMGWAMARCAERRIRTLTLAVDEQNEPALRLYRRWGLSRTGRKRVFIRSLGS